MMRMHVHVGAISGDDWPVQITFEDGSTDGVMRREVREIDGRREVMAWAAAPDEAQRHQGFDALARYLDRTPEPGDMSLVGAVLLQALLGPTWTRVAAAVAAGKRDDLLELALEWDAGDGDLTSLPWELLHDANGFLLLRHPYPVTITRIVQGDATTVSPQPGLPRALFAIGVDLTDPVIRPGAELMGLLAETSHEVATLNSVVLERATLDLVAQSAAEFKPHFVHLISHGDVDEAGGYILLKDPEDPRQQKAVYGDQLGAAVCGNHHAPLVVLSSCYGATAGGPGALTLAAAMIKAGVPAVVAMSGTVRDRACRLFARSFVRALAAGEPLGEAMAHGRCAAYFDGESAERSVDWALPTLFCADGVGAKTVFVEPPPAQADRRSWIRDLKLTGYPVFCGRTQFLAAYRDLFTSTGVHSLVIAAPSERGLGENRLMTEMASRAVRDGHLPIYVKVLPDGGQPKESFLHVALLVLKTALLLGEKLRFTPTKSSLLALLDRDGAAAAASCADPRQRHLEYLTLFDACFAKSWSVGPDTARVALSMDLAHFLETARAHGCADEGSRMVVLLAGIERWHLATDELLHVIDGYGLGGDQLVPVVMTWIRGMQDDLLAEVANRSAWPHVKVMPLEPFAQDEALLAAEWVFMHYPPTKAFEEFLPCVVDPQGKWRDMFEIHVGRIPGMLSQATLPACAQHAVALKEGRPIDDEARLDKYLADLRRTS